MSTLKYRAALVVSFAGLLSLALVSSPIRAEDKPAAEQEFIALLQSDAPAKNKAIACKKLAVVGTEAAVPELAKLLSDEHLASWARIALEAIPGAASDAALRTAAGSVDGDLLVGVVNSIGVRRDAGAIELLIGLMGNSNPTVASSASVALGRIGNETATRTLRDALASAPDNVRSAVAEGCILCAERALSDGQTAEAIAIYDQVRSAKVPQQRIVEATRGAILARGDEGIPLLVENLRSGEKKLFEIALTTAREIPGNKIDAALAAELPTMAPFRAPALVATMADRPETVVLSAIQDAAASGPTPVRLAAILALGRVGNVSCMELLLNIAGGGEAELSPSAKQALAVLPGDSVDPEIVARVAKATGGVYLALIELIGVRRIAALDPLLKALENSDQAVRAASLASLGRTVPADRLAILITQATKPKHAEDAATARQALKTAAIRMPDREACATEIAAAVKGAPTATHIALLEILAAVGGTQALEAVQAAARMTDLQVRDASTRLLGDWTTIDAAPVLLDLAKNGPNDRFRVRTLRGYMRIARQFVMEDADRLAMCRNGLEVSDQPAEQKLVLEVLERHPTLDLLKLGLELLQRPALKDDAVRSTLIAAQKIADHNDEVVVLLKQAGLPKMKVEVVKAEYGSGGLQKDVTDVLKPLANELPVLVLPKPTYNESFGGDPAPDAQKKLRVQYTIDGKPAEATFNENRLIVLTLPKA